MRLAGAIKGVRVAISPPTMQADAALSQANPVSTTLYEVLPTTRNVRIISLSADITWAVTQPTPLEIVVTIDGNTIIYARNNPVSSVRYIGFHVPYNAENNQADMYASAASTLDAPFAFLLEGKSVRVQVRVTWATTQPTPLVCRVKWAKY